MLKRLVMILLIGFLLLPSPASAQTGPRLDSMNVELWSEYDQPTVLVINEFVVSQDTPLPATVTMRFPKNGNLVAVAVQNNGELFNKDFTGPVEQGAWQTITVNVESYDPHRVEYYQPFTRDGSKRQFKYQWFGDYYVKDFTVSIRIPVDSEEIITSPVLQKTETITLGEGSALSGTVARNELKMGSSFQFNLEYQRTSEALIDPRANQIQPAAPVDTNTTGRVSIKNLPWIIGGFGLALIIVALFSYLRSTQSGDGKPQRRRRRLVKPAKSDEGAEAYCHECGARAYAGDKFCRTCGTRLRVT
ncbi:MAG TPA: zinc ribbon domain-containing protein [Anaerolineales bacterium]|nr:zinc ribbon domain-containing protein [Anaerolineales bacterium]